MTTEEASRFKILKSEDSNRCATFEFNEEDHTLGNALRHMILKNPEVKFCGYALPHPNERKINLQIQVYSGEALDALEKGLRDLVELNRIVKDAIVAEYERFGPVELVDSEEDDDDDSNQSDGNENDPAKPGVDKDGEGQAEQETITMATNNAISTSTDSSGKRQSTTDNVTIATQTKSHLLLDINQEPIRFLLPDSSLLEDVEIALSNLTNHELQLIRDTESLFKQQVDYMKQIDEIRQHIPRMDSIKNGTKNLSSLVDNSHKFVEKVCSKFRRIDLAKIRLDDSLAKIGDVLDLKTCRDGMMSSMQSKNYEEAAMHVKRYLSIDQTELQKTIKIICGELASFDSRERTMNSASGSNQYTGTTLMDESGSLSPESLNLCLRELNEARLRLLALCRDNMTRAIKEDNTRDIERFFKIFPMLNEHLDGLKRFSEYLQSKVLSQQLNDILASKEMNQADKLAALYEHIARMIDHHQPLIETYYGPGHLLIVTTIVQKESDRLSRKILEEFRNATNLQHVAKLVRSSSLRTIGLGNNTSISGQQQQATSQMNLNPSKLDPRTVDKILNEISLIVSRSEVYLSFIVQRIKEDIESKAENEAQRKAGQIELYNMIFYNCELNHLVQEVGGIYVMLEQFYLNESSKKAILMDQIDIDPAHSCLISSMLDDIFFIIKKCIKRAVLTKSNEVFCAIINHCVTLLESTFCQVLEERLKNQQYYTSFSAKNLDFSQALNAIQSGRYLQSTNDQEKSNAQYFSALNNLDKACDYMKTLRGILDSDVKKLKPSILVLEASSNNQLEKSVACLNDLSQLANRFTSIINSSLYQLFNTSLRSRIRTELKTVMDENPDLTTIVACNPNELRLLARSLLKAADNSLEKSLLPEIHARLVSITGDFLASILKTIK